MTVCVAYGCKSRSEKREPGMTFHRFPKDPKRRRLWVLAVRRADWSPSPTSYICSRHFTEDMIDRTSTLIVRLKDDAVPTIFDEYTVNLKKELKTSKSQPELVISDIQSAYQECFEEDSGDINGETTFNVQNKNDSDTKRIVIISDDIDITEVLNDDVDDTDNNRIIIISDVANDEETYYEEDSDADHQNNYNRPSSPVFSNEIYERTLIEQEKIIKALKRKVKLTQQQARRNKIIIKRLLKEISVVKNHIPKTPSNSKPIVHVLANERRDQENRALSGENIANAKTRVTILLENNEDQELSGKMNNITNFLETFENIS